MSLFDKINTKLTEDKKEPISDKEKVYRSKRDAKAKELGYKSGSELEKTVDRGIRAVDRKTGRKLPKVGYATGEPFQPDANTKTQRYEVPKVEKGQKSITFVKVPGTGKYETSGEKTLKGRLVDYPSMDKDFSKAVKSGEVERDVVKRLKTRLNFAAGKELGGKKGVDKFLDKALANQRKKRGGPISPKTGIDSELYKIIKKDQDIRNPTVPSKVVNPKTGKRFRIPMPGGYDPEAPGGRTGTKAQQRAYDQRVEKAVARRDKELVRQAKLPKDLKLPKNKVDGQTMFEPKELNLDLKAAKMKLDYGGRMAERDPKYQAMTSAQKKANFEKLKKTIYNKKSSQPFKGPQTFSTYKYDRKNIVPTGLKGRGAPKFRDINKSIPFRQATRDSLKKNKKFTAPLKFTSLKNKGAVKYKKTFGDFAKQAGKFIIKNPKKATLTGLGIGALATVGVYGASKLFGGKKPKAVADTLSRSQLRNLPTATYMDSKTGRPIKYTYGGSKEKNPYGRIGSLESSKKLAAGIKDKSLYLSKFKKPGKA